MIDLSRRLAFLFLAVLIPVEAGEVLKGVIGRGRPFVGGATDAFHYSHFAWTEAYASFPSGHAITAFALAFALASLAPKWRIAIWAYAAVIAMTRMILLAHHPSDVLAGALVGILGDHATGAIGNIGDTVTFLMILQIPCVFLVWRYMPETKGMELEEVAALSPAEVIAP